MLPPVPLGAVFWGAYDRCCNAAELLWAGSTAPDLPAALLL